MSVTTFGDLDQHALEQLVRCVEAGDAPAGVLLADHHVGYSMPIGGVVAYREFVSPSGVGYDIACGNKAVKTNLRSADVEIAPVMDEIARRISFGMGRANNEPAEHPVLDHIREAPFAPQRQLRDLATKQLGTVGAGNHYVDLFDDEQGDLWLGVHFGSRGFGHKTACGFLALAQGKPFGQRVSEGGMDAPPTLIGLDSELGQGYLEAMRLAGEYAYAGRDLVCAKVLQILGAQAVEEVHNHHNFAWIEEHNGEQVVVVRKGATPIWPGQQSFIGGSMGDLSVIVEGIDGEQARQTLYSTVHGAGRAMSRSKAAGKIKRRTVYSCGMRDCDYEIAAADYHEGATCPRHGKKLRRWRRTEQVAPGLIDFEAVKVSLREQGIELRGGAADEAPGAYKPLTKVLRHHSDSTRVVHTLRPLGVAMAGPDTVDEYKD